VNADVVDGENVGVVQAGSGHRFLLEAPHPCGVAADTRRQHLDGDLPTETRVHGSVDFAHAARSEERDDFVRAEARAGCKRHSGNAGRHPNITLPQAAYFS
jgi:hypothetical protein